MPQEKVEQIYQEPEHSLTPGLSSVKSVHGMTDLDLTYLAPGDKAYRQTLQAIQSGQSVPEALKGTYDRLPGKLRETDGDKQKAKFGKIKGNYELAGKVYPG